MAETTTSIRTYLFIIASEFTTTDNTELSMINTLIDDAMNTHSESSLGSSFKKTIAYYVAHQLKLQGFTPASSSSGSSGSSTQEVLKRKAGNLEITYSSNSVRKTQTITSSLESTSYGAMYQSLMSNAIETPMFLY